MIHNSHLKQLKISPKVQEKLASKHGVSRREVEQCFENRDGPLLMDSREEHRTNPPTLWFLSETNRGRLLKVVYIQRGEEIHLRTCYEPNPMEIAIYQRARQPRNPA